MAVQVNPPGMGPVDVRIQVQGAQVHTAWTVTHGTVQGALLAHTESLRQALVHHGLQLAGMQVGVRGGGSGSAFAGRNHGGSARYAQPQPPLPPASLRHGPSGLGRTPAARPVSRLDLVG